MSCSGCYEEQIFRTNGNRPAPYDLEAIIAVMRDQPVGPVTLHGGEIALMPVADLRVLCEAARAQGRHINIQTSGAFLTEALIELFAEFKIGVGISLNGPAELNRDRFIHSLPVTDDTTMKVHQNLKLLKDRCLGVGIITVLSKTNASTEELVDRLIEWACGLGEQLGIWDIRFNPMHDDAGEFELTAEQASRAYCKLADATFHDSRRMWLPFREFVDNLWGLGRQPCWQNECDVYATSAVNAVFGDGSRGNCLRTAKDGIPYLRSGEPTDLRGSILEQIPLEDGGCKGCRYWRVCRGGCPADGLDGDWRNKSRFCQMYIDTYALIERRIQGLMPNFTPLPDWTTDDESRLMNSILNRKPEVSPLNPADPRWSQHPSTYSRQARTQRH